MAIELPNSAGRVARITVRHGVSANQRETILMLIDGMNGDLPATHLMAKLTLRSVSPPVNVGVAILAIVTNIGKYRVDVAFLAADVGMHAAKWKRSFAVIEFRLASNRPPRRNRVAFLARNLQWAMGTLRLGGSMRLLLRQYNGSELRQQKREKEEPIR